jgi:hypothetical protein
VLFPRITALHADEANYLFRLTALHAVAVSVWTARAYHREFGAA